MDTASLLEGLFDSKKMKVIRVMMQDTSKQYYLRELSKSANVPVATTFRIIQKLMALGLVKQIKVSKFKVYQWQDNEKSKFVEQIMKEDLRILSYFVEELKKISGVQLVIQHGREMPDKANVLIIGDFVNHEELKKIVLMINEKYKFKISHLTLTEEQYKQMLTMGLYAGTKKTLFDSKNQ